jgi:hypothetical protein
MSKAEEALTIKDFAKGRKFRVLREGCYIWGWQPILGGAQGAKHVLAVGEIIECLGMAYSGGSDGVHMVQFKAKDDQTGVDMWGSQFHPHEGFMWGGMPPLPGYVEPVEEA